MQQLACNVEEANLINKLGIEINQLPARKAARTLRGP
jgi:hypothetical protein